ncbi:hypothetical protein LOZ64_003587 [Ophidiomyces ophidiicola]|nr:hypothetical protein LOZ64_003587 [Ophidiomyces ophidiicola]KAI2016480.1 hypothetical protein LOZ46_005012 [Ophidiomyces ophidiicola]KAI2130055.1 hypothetical protein LOZ29_005890 [Ophidiomyces ophidiicola]KAI2134553.1 hypothetical protein LOZ28_004910 [Ophidiomyces ophidiicola]KAI2214384.1 hypothetical protein LOZ15_004828 [Ophidiomyces ophidiicola]
MPLLEARVKSVLSGDTLVLTHVTNRSQERILSLAYVSAPRLRREGDEPFAFQSREFLRELLVGKVIQFQVLYTVPTGAKREYGLVKLPGGRELPELCISEGWVKVREDAGRRDESEDTALLLAKLRDLESQARADAKGVWGQAPTIDMSYEASEPKALVDSLKGTMVDAVVERVLNGDRLVVRMLVSPQKHVQTLLVVAGVRAPSAKRVNADETEQPGEPYGDQAQQFVEIRLLQRRVKVSLHGTTPQNQLIGTVLHPNGNIAKFLLEEGLARCADHHSTLLGNEMATFRQAEKAAKDARKGLFAAHVAPKPAASAGADTDFVVSRILNADTIFVRNKAGKEKKVSLSSIRQPKPSDAKQAPFGVDAKEFLRKKLIGKHVKVAIDGKRPATEGFEEREVGTVMAGGTNIALALVEAGYASVIRHRRDDDDRSPDYDGLLQAEEVAQKEQRGMWSSKPPKTKQYQDYSENLQKAKMEASVLQRQKKVPAIVDYVKSGARFTVLIPRDNAKLTFVLSGIRAPKSARNANEASEPFGQEAHDFSSRRCTQRDVEIDVETIDKVGGFIGTLYVNRENFAKVLLEEGLATVHAYSAEQSGHGPELFAAEKKAKEARKGVWHDWDPSKEADNEYDEPTPANGAESAAPLERRKDYRDVLVTGVEEDCKVKIQQIGAGTTALTDLMNSFRSFHLNKTNDKSLDAPKAGDLVAARFTEDNEWYRAKIRRNDREAKQADVVYIDYGNSEKIPWSRLRPLSEQFSVQKLKPQAADAVLAFVQFPVSPEYLADARNFVAEQTFDRQLVANVEHTADGALYVSLMDPSDSKNLEQSINADIIREGLAMVPRKLKAWERSAGDTLAHLRKLEEEAKEQRRGIWEYGDITED